MPTVLLPSLLRSGWKPWQPARAPGAGRELLKQIGPLLSSNLASQGLGLLERMVASLLGEGAVTWINLARKLINLPLIALMSLNQVLLGLMSGSAGSERLSLLRKGLASATLLTLPAVAGLIGAAAALVSLLLPSQAVGSPLPELLAWFCVPLLFGAWNALLARYAYAAGDTRMPLNCELAGSDRPGGHLWGDSHRSAADAPARVAERSALAQPLAARGRRDAHRRAVAAPSPGYLAATGPEHPLRPGVADRPGTLAAPVAADGNLWRLKHVNPQRGLCDPHLQRPSGSGTPARLPGSPDGAVRYADRRLQLQRRHVRTGYFALPHSKDFNHGGTRQMMVERHPEYDIYVFMTQDAYLEDPEALANIVWPFTDDSIGAVCGRQLAHLDASPLAEHARLFNYPPTSQVKSMEDAPRLGIKTAFASNSFCAYRRQALMQIGGFPQHVILSEDMYVAAKMLLAGWKVAYEGSACCRHSHNYTLWEEFRRYFDIGVFHAREPWIRQAFGGAGGEGLRYVLSELKFLGPSRLSAWPGSFLRNAVKLFAYKLSQQERYLPKGLKKRLGMYKRYWDSPYA